jgi:hypothetical protein
MLPPLDAINLEPADQAFMSRGGSGRHRQSSGAAPPHQNSVSLSFNTSSNLGKLPAMGNFGAKLSSEERFVVRDPHDRALPPSTFGHLRLRVYPPSPSPSWSPKCQVPSLPPLNISKLSTRSPSLPSENPGPSGSIPSNMQQFSCPSPMVHSTSQGSGSSIGSGHAWQKTEPKAEKTERG